MNTVPKLVAPELRLVLENGVKNNHRSFIIMVGSKCLFQVPTIYNILSQLRKEPLNNILWCYKKDLQLSSNQEKQNKQIQKLKEKGLVLDETANQIHVFLNSHKIRYCKYKDTSSILGKTYDMLILQNFEDITPNNFARTIETVSGGGTIILLLEKMKNLEEMYEVSMSFHKGMRTDNLFGSTTNNLARRFHKSIQKCGNCVCIDDEYNILSRIIEKPTLEIYNIDNKELKDTKKKVSDLPTIGPIVAQTVTIDQARTVLHIIDVIQTGELSKVVGITASRGRGKSAALGLSLAAAIANNYSNIFVTAPSPENLDTLFQFVLKGFDALGYKEGSDYDIEASNSNEKKSQHILRINVHRPTSTSLLMRQTISYIKPNDSDRLAQCEILAIDEAAAIPLPIVRKLIGRYTVLLSSTINGYEGTGRALSLKLFDELRKKSKGAFSEVELKAPIRYAPNDPVEKWLHSFLCLDAQPSEPKSLPDPNKCQLMLVNRSMLFAGATKTDEILSSIVALSVASHYKNEPDDLILMADSPNHRVFALIPPLQTSEGQSSSSLPDIICYIQVALEGKILRKETDDAINRGKSPQGDLIPWTVSKHLLVPEFTSLTGIRIVRIAVHPQMQGKGYGSVAIKQLLDYYSSPNIINPDDKPSKPIFFRKLLDTPHEKVDYAGVSFGLTEGLFKFWRRSDFAPVYISQNRNKTTGEHSIIVLRPLNDFDVDNDENDGEENWLTMFCDEFRKTFVPLLDYEDFSSFSPRLVDMILASVEPKERVDFDGSIELNADDATRLQKFSKQLIEFDDVKYLIPTLAKIYFQKNAKIQFTRLQQSILTCVGLQHCSVDECASRLGIQVNQVFAFLQKICEACFNYLSGSIDMTASKLRLKTAKTD